MENAELISVVKALVIEFLNSFFDPTGFRLGVNTCRKSERQEEQDQPTHLTSLHNVKNPKMYYKIKKLCKVNKKNWNGEKKPRRRGASRALGSIAELLNRRTFFKGMFARN
ncbi:MAG: hypothetical protein J1F07_05810 [Muribaculaceae bacterium]|nr:hypothetical protein [Muribaculaceae bacterium]